MAERLTIKNSDNTYSQPTFEMVFNKLGELEDIMERLGINFVEDLEDEIKSLRVDKYVYKKDRDTWQKACELACETLKQVMGKPLWIGGNIPAPEVKDSEYFYQQAKKEGNDERKS